MLTGLNTPIRLLCYVLFSFIAASNTHAIKMSLNGIANYQLLNQDHYIAALYLPKQVNIHKSAEMLANTQNKQMKLLVRSAQISPRVWKNQWQSDLDINNPQATGALLKQLNEFSELLNANLMAGDLIVIDYQANLGTQIFINDQPLQSTPDIALFNALLATWIGKLPPSRDFKQRILTLINDPVTHDSLQALYTNTITQKRKMAILKWRYSDQEISNMAHEKALSNQKILDLKARLLSRKEAKVELQKQQIRLAKAQALEKEIQLAREKELTIKKQKQLKIQAEFNKNQQLRWAAIEKDYYKNLYHWQLYTRIRKNIHYPVLAREFNEEGKVKASFTINAQGEIIDTQFNDEEVSSFLINEVRESIDKISGKVPPPAGLPGSQWQFSVSHNFSFSSKKQNPVKAPVKPHHL